VGLRGKREPAVSISRCITHRCVPVLAYAAVNDLRLVILSHCILTETFHKYCLLHSTFTEKELAARRTNNFALFPIFDLSYIWLLL